jgi:DNA-binding NarL/FixJ family response regulator
MAQLRNVMDGGEQFMGGHGIVKARTYKRKVPEWTKSDKAIRKVILRAFPKTTEDPSQRKAASRWASVIHLYFRLGYTRSQIAEELNSTTLKIHNVVRSILRVSKGLRADGTGVLGAPKGRPRKRHALKLS